MTDDPVLVAGARILHRRMESGTAWDPGLEADEESVRLQECANCGHVRYPRATYCPECLSTDVTMRAISGQGTIWSYAVYHRAYDDAFADSLPYVVALVELDEGPQLIGAVIETPADELAVGMPVMAVSRALVPGCFAVYFRSVT